MSPAVTRMPPFGVFLGVASLIGTGLFAGIAITQGGGVLRVLLTGLFAIAVGLLAGVILLATLLRRHPLMRAYQSWAARNPRRLAVLYAVGGLPFFVGLTLQSSSILPRIAAGLVIVGIAIMFFSPELARLGRGRRGQ